MLIKRVPAKATWESVQQTSGLDRQQTLQTSHRVVM